MKRKVWILILMAVMGVAVAFPAGATMEISFGATLQPGQVQYYWNDVPAAERTANFDGRTPASSPVGGDVTLAVPALPMDALASGRWQFWAGSAPVASQSLFIRVWDTAGRDHWYTNLAYFANPASGFDRQSFGAPSYLYIKAKPATPIISTIEDKGTTDLTVTPSTLTRTVTFKSSAPLVESKTVEIASSIWNVNGTDRAATSGKDLTLSTAAGDDLTAGTTYTIKVKHVNLWGGAAGTSDNYSTPDLVYIVGAGPTPGGPGVTSITLNLVSTGMGINQFTLPFVPAYRGTNEIRTIAQLVAQINAAPGGDVVRSVGWWDTTSQIDMGYIVSAGSLTPVNTTLDPATTALEANKAYQITVSGAKTVVLNSTSTP